MRNPEKNIFEQIRAGYTNANDTGQVEQVKPVQNVKSRRAPEGKQAFKIRMGFSGQQEDYLESLNEASRPSEEWKKSGGGVGSFIKEMSTNLKETSIMAAKGLATMLVNMPQMAIKEKTGVDIGEIELFKELYPGQREDDVEAYSHYVYDPKNRPMSHYKGFPTAVDQREPMPSPEEYEEMGKRDKALLEEQYKSFKWFGPK